MSVCVCVCFGSKGQVKSGRMEARVGNLIFTSKFDSGNLAKVEKVTRDDDDEPVNTSKMTMFFSFLF